MYISKTGVSLLILSSAAKASFGQTNEKPLLWAEEFDYAPSSSAVTPNISVWTADTGKGPNNDGWGNGELQTYTSDLNNVRVENGQLFLTALKTSDNAGFTSGRIHSDKKLLFKYATITMKAKTPNVDRGLWPAFWTLGRNVSEDGWPKAGEMNIMEVGQGLGSSIGLANKRIVAGLHWQEDDWTKDYISTYIDDTLVFTKAIDSTSCPSCTAFHDYHFMILNLAVGGGFTAGSSSSSSSTGCGSTSASGNCSEGLPTVNDITAPIPAEFQIDWIRIFNNSETEIMPQENQGLPDVEDPGNSGGGDVVIEPSPTVPDQPTPTVPTAEGNGAGDQTDISPVAPPSSDAGGNIILRPRRTTAPATSPPITSYSSNKGKAGKGGKGSSKSGKGSSKSSKSSKSGKGSNTYSSTESALNASAAKDVPRGDFLSSLFAVSVTVFLFATFQC